MTGISVVIPTKDRLTYLQRAVPMFLSHEEVKEIIIVIDGCQDRTLEYVRSACADSERIRYTDNVTNRGLPYSRNRGIEMAKFDYIFTGEDDLTLFSGFFTTLLAHMEETGADIISGRNIFQLEHETTSEAIQRTDKLKGDAVNRRTIMVHTGMRTSSDQEQPLLPAPMLCKADVFRKIKFDDKYENNAWREESDFQLAAREHGYKLVFCPHAISFNLEIKNDRGGVHASAGIKRIEYVVRNNWRFVKKHRQVIDRDFDAGNLYLYIAKFAVRRVRSELILPMLGNTKNKLVKLIRISLQAVMEG
jgi:glycosyltransferase involved in cell wall biosynthesis